MVCREIFRGAKIPVLSAIGRCGGHENVEFASESRHTFIPVGRWPGIDVNRVPP